MNVLIIPEDFRKDQWMLKPVIEALMAAAGRAKARVRVCTDPLLGGVSAALDWENIREVIQLYPMVDLFLLCTDRDGEEGRQQSISSIERRGAGELTAGRVLLGECAWQEIEVWLLAGVRDLPSEWRWADIRAHRDPKEAYYLPYAKQRGLASDLGEGRKAIGAEAARNYATIRAKCPEDIARLEDRVRQWLAIRADNGHSAEAAGAAVLAWICD